MTDFPSPPSRPAAITGVAREAGIGKANVSRYLNDGTQVLSGGLRQRAETAIQRLNYRLNQMARSLKRDHNRPFGMLVADPTNPYTIEVLQGVEAACHALDYMPFIRHAVNEIEMERRFVQLLMTYRVKGLIVDALSAEEAVLRPLQGDGIPAVLVDHTVEGFGADLVGFDNHGAISLGMQYLLDQGFDTIQFTVQPFRQVSSRHEREHAFRGAMIARGWPAERAVVLDPNDTASTGRTLAETAARIDAVHSRGGERPALFIANTPMALIAARHLRTQFGATWQEHAALLSTDDPERAELIGTTTTRQPTHDIGYRAVEFVHERIEGVVEDARIALLPSTLVERVSTVRAVEAA